MRSKLAGHLPLQDMIAQTLESARVKIAAAEDKESGKVKKLVEYEKKEHGGKIPSVKDEEDEKKKMSSVLDSSDPESMDKLASALDEMGEEFLKEADSVENGGEAKQGGEQLATQSPTGGKQVYTGAKAKHQVPTSTGMQGDPSQGKASTQVPNDHARAPGGTGAKYPAKGVLKTAGASVLQAVVEKLAQEKLAEFPPKKDEGEKEEKGEKKDEGKKKGFVPFGKKDDKEKKSEAVGFILNKLAEFHGGGETLDDKPAPVPSNEGRQLIANNKAPVSATKREAKGPGRKQLSEVLSEPAQTKSTDSTVQDNLRNAAKGGVKIAAVKSFLGKIAEAGCVCAGAGECDYCRMKSSVEKKRAEKKVKQSLGAPPMGPAPTAGGPMGGSPTGGM